jgi:hypothetical protein
MKDILVEFTENGAIVHKDPKKIESLKDMPYCFFNPDLSKVSGISPSYWVYVNDEIISASPEEKKRRDEYRRIKPSENTVSLKQTVELMRQELYNDFKQDIEELEQSVQEIKNSNESSIANLSTNLSSELDAKLVSLKAETLEEIKNVDKQNAENLSVVFSSIEEVNNKLNALKANVDDSVENLHDISNQIINSLDVQNISLNNEINALATLISKSNEYISDIKEQFVLSKNDIQWHIGELSYKVHNLEQKDDTNLKALEKQIKYLKLFLLGSAILTIILRII